MTQFQQARKNMVDCQIQTSGVIIPEVLEAFETLPREAFLPEDLRGIAYRDEELRLSNGRCLLEPVVLARMIEALEPQNDQAVLVIGSGAGYAAGILSKVCMTVVALEEDDDLINHANKAWEDLEIQNILSFKGTLKKGHSKNAPYDLILINGAVGQISQEILSQLSENGRLVAIEKTASQPVGDVKLVQHVGENQFSSYTVFQAGCDYLPGFEPAPAFSF